MHCRTSIGIEGQLGRSVNVMVEADNTPAKKTKSPRILVADDDPVSLRILQTALQKWGHEVIAATDGIKAWQVLTEPEAPLMAVLDWMMPGMDGPTICRRIRDAHSVPTPYLILLTARTDQIDIVAGLDAGANDYVTKPFRYAEFRARIRVGVRVLDLQAKLAEQVRDLELALKQVKLLRGLLPICMYCKKIRKDGNYWQQVEAYITEHSQAEFSHGICPECYEKILKSQIE